MFIRVVIVGIFIAYPFIVYFGIRFFPPSFFGLFLVALLALRFGVLAPGERLVLLPVLSVFLGYAIVTAVLDSAAMLLYYPALVNFSLFVTFANSLRYEEPLLLKLVRGRAATIRWYTPRYLYRLTAFWAGFFLLNGIVSLWTSTLSMETWTVYNGLISYFIVAVLLVGELLFRSGYKRKMDAKDPQVF